MFSQLKCPWEPVAINRQFVSNVMGVYTIIFRHRPGVVSQEAATSLRGPAVSEALVSDKKLLSLLSPVTAVTTLCRPPWG